MATSARSVQKSLDSLSPEQLEQVADFIAFLQFKQEAEDADSALSQSGHNTALSAAHNGTAPFCNIQPMFD
ncbi:MAG: hypothetical protein AAGM36_02250 [Cyanobacteria bacterium J06597_1]